MWASNGQSCERLSTAISWDSIPLKILHNFKALNSMPTPKRWLTCLYLQTSSQLQTLRASCPLNISTWLSNGISRQHVPKWAPKWSPSSNRLPLQAPNSICFYPGGSSPLLWQQWLHASSVTLSSSLTPHSQRTLMALPSNDSSMWPFLTTFPVLSPPLDFHIGLIKDLWAASLAPASTSQRHFKNPI